MKPPVNIIFKLDGSTFTCEESKSVEPGLEQIVKAIVWTIKPRTTAHVVTTLVVTKRAEDYEIVAISMSKKTLKRTSKTKILPFINIGKAASSYDHKHHLSSEVHSDEDDTESTNIDLQPVQVIADSVSSSLQDGSEDIKGKKRRNIKQADKEDAPSAGSALDCAQHFTQNDDDANAKTQKGSRHKSTRDKQVIIQQVPVIIKEEVVREVIKEIPVVVKEEVIKEVIKEVRVVEEVIKEVIKEVNIGTECPICFDKTIDCSLDPCGHVFCMICANNFRHANNLCPNCRSYIQQIKRIYY